MSTAPPAPQIAPPTRPRGHWWRVALTIVALAGLSVAGVLGYFALSLHNDWVSAEEEADRSDPRWRLMDLEADRPAIADGDNAAFVIISAKRKAGIVSVIGVPNYDQVFAKLPPTAQLNDQQVQLIQMQLARIPAALTEARSLKDLPRGRFAVSYSDDWISTLLPHHQDARALADWLVHDAYVLAHEEHGDDALDSCRAIINTGRTAGDDRFLISHLIRLAIQSMAVPTIERVLAQGNASEEKLATLQAQITREIEESNWSGALRSERAGAHHLFENIRSGKIRTTALSGMATGRRPQTLSEWILDVFPTTMLKYYPDHLRRMNKIVEVSKRPLHEQKARLDALKDEKEDAQNPVIHLLLPALDKLHGAEVRTQGLLRAAQAGLACERYRVKHGEWPESLDALVAEKLLAAVPRDPIDGQPLRYRRHAESIVIYSIGPDGRDDGGHIDRARALEPGIDNGFRLWSESLRRGAPRPPIVAAPEMP